MDWKRHGFPPGFRFAPTDEELIEYLDRKLYGLPLPLPAVFHDINIEDLRPDEAADTYEDEKDDGYIYFFASRQLMRAKGKRTRRTMKDGTWKISGVARPIVRNNVEIGMARTLVYFDKGKTKTNWYMHEYTSKQSQINGKLENLALCRLYGHEDPQKRKRARPEAVEEHNATFLGAGYEEPLELQLPIHPASSELVIECEGFLLTGEDIDRLLAEDPFK